MPQNCLGRTLPYAYRALGIVHSLNDQRIRLPCPRQERLYSHGLYSYGLCSYGLHSHGLCSYGSMISASGFHAPSRNACACAAPACLYRYVRTRVYTCERASVHGGVCRAAPRRAVPRRACILSTGTHIPAQ